MSPMYAALRAALPGLVVGAAALAVAPTSLAMPVAFIAAIISAGTAWMTRFSTGRDMAVALMAMFGALGLRLGGASVVVLFFILPLPASNGRTVAMATLLGCLVAGLVIEMIDRLAPVSQETARD